MMSAAFSRGFNALKNPYLPGSLEAQEWRSGWKAAALDAMSPHGQEQPRTSRGLRAMAFGTFILWCADRFLHHVAIVLTKIGRCMAAH